MSVRCLPFFRYHPNMNSSLISYVAWFPPVLRHREKNADTWRLIISRDPPNWDSLMRGRIQKVLFTGRLHAEVGGFSHSLYPGQPGPYSQTFWSQAKGLCRVLFTNNSHHIMKFNDDTHDTHGWNIGCGRMAIFSSMFFSVRFFLEPFVLERFRRFFGIIVCSEWCKGHFF